MNAEFPAVFTDLLITNKNPYTFKYLFIFFEYFTEHAQLFSFAAILLASCFMMTSSDSACYVVAYQFEQRNMMRSKKIRVIWCLVLSAITLIAHGNMAVNYAVAIIGSLAFGIILLLKIIACSMLIYRRITQGKLPLEATEYIYDQGKEYNPLLQGGQSQQYQYAPTKLAHLMPSTKPGIK